MFIAALVVLVLPKGLTGEELSQISHVADDGWFLWRVAVEELRLAAAPKAALVVACAKKILTCALVYIYMYDQWQRGRCFM